MNSASASEASIAPATVPPEDLPSSNVCADRHDDHGIWNQIKTVYMYFLHFGSCLMLVISMVLWVHDKDFNPGNPRSVLDFHHRLYQTQVNGILSFALVLIRLVAGACSSLLIWTMILILLEKRGMSLGEMIRLNDYKVPIVPRVSNKTQGLWFAWAVSVVILLWPHGFASPLANSALAWIPSTRLVENPERMSMSVWGPNGDLSDLTIDWRMRSVMNAVVMAGIDPAYSFDRRNPNQRRYFNAPPDMTKNSHLDADLPFFDVQLEWINATSDKRSNHINNTAWSDFINPVYPNGPSGLEGSVMLLRDKYWKIPQAPNKADVVQETRLVAIRVGEHDLIAEDGSNVTTSGVRITEKTPCPDWSKYFGDLPDFGPYKLQRKIHNDFAGFHCYQVGIVTITAGLFRGEDCNVYLQESGNASATCSNPQNLEDVQEDWVAGIAIDMISEVSKYVGMVYPMYQWMDRGIDDFTTGMLTLAYHAAWSSVMATRANDTEEVKYKKAEIVVRANVDKSKLYGWLFMQLCLSVSAILVRIALRFSSVKVIRDTTLAALTLDFSEITHDSRAPGLCNAVALSKKDGGLPMVKFDSGESNLLKGGEKSSLEDRCCRRVVFVNENKDEV